MPLGAVYLSLTLLMAVAIPLAARADEACAQLPTPVCVLDLARQALGSFATAPEPPESAAWTEDMAQYPDIDIRGEAWRVVWDVYAHVAEGYAILGLGDKAQEALDAIGNAGEIASRLDKVVRAKPDVFDREWLRKSISNSANAAFPFNKAGSYLDDYTWQELLDLAVELGLPEVVLEQERRFDDYAASKDFAALEPSRQDEAHTSVLHATLLRNDFAGAERRIAEIADPNRKEYGNMLLAEALARSGDTQKALALSRDMAPVRRNGVEVAAAKNTVLNGDPEVARRLVQGLGAQDQQLLALDIGKSGNLKAMALMRSLIRTL